jgi:cobalamin-dependent methionine synthase I
LAVQVRADAYEKIDKELLEFVEDVLLNRCENATERMLEYAATLDPKSHPTAVRKKGQVRLTASSQQRSYIVVGINFRALAFPLEGHCATGTSIKFQKGHVTAFQGVGH